jgi:hypothetical protein
MLNQTNNSIDSIFKIASPILTPTDKNNEISMKVLKCVELYSFSSCCMYWNKIILLNQLNWLC